MKLVLVAIFLCSSIHAASEQQALYKKHRLERHEENKKWEATKADCYKNYPNRRDVKHSDYDAHFKCMETIQDAQIALEEKQDLETCKEINYGCK